MVTIRAISTGSGARSTRTSAFIGLSCGLTIYIHFLLFAQFGFLELLRGAGFDAAEIRVLLGAMGASGFFASLLLPSLSRRTAPLTVLRIGFVVSALSIGGALAQHALSFPLLVLVSGVIGAGIALTTVSLNTLLGDLFRGRRLGLWAGLGTGLAYFICNIPWLFEAPPASKGAVAGVAQLLGLLLTFGIADDALAERGERREATAMHTPLGFAMLVGMFLGLIWLDSAAFYVIQNTSQLRVGSWDTPLMQWRNGAIHLVAALGAGWFLEQRKLPHVLFAAYVLLASAVLLFDHVEAAAPLASILYVTAVSSYSSVLSGYGALSGSGGPPPLVWRVGILFAIAGWMGSALGVGMAQDLHHVPTLFLIASGVVITACAFYIGRRKSSPPSSTSSNVEPGRRGGQPEASHR